MSAWRSMDPWNTKVLVELMIASASATSASSAVISLTRSGVRCESRASAFRVMTDRVLRGRQPEHVADPAQGVDEPRLNRVDLPAEHGHVGLHDAGVATEVVVPHVVQDLHLGQHPVGVAHEVTEQLELGGGELDLLPGPPTLVAFLVELADV